MPSVVAYLSKNGVVLIDPDSAWRRLVRSGRDRSLETARLLLDLGYLPGESVAQMLQDPRIRNKQPELAELLSDYSRP